jgi:hypothetical protein
VGCNTGRSDDCGSAADVGEAFRGDFFPGDMLRSRDRDRCGCTVFSNVLLRECVPVPEFASPATMDSGSDVADVPTPASPPGFAALVG